MVGHKIFDREVVAICTSSVTNNRRVHNNAELEQFRQELKVKLGKEHIYFILKQV